MNEVWGRRRSRCSFLGNEEKNDTIDLKLKKKKSEAV